MMEKCYDEGTLQAFLDNELSTELSQRVARHLVDCDPCAILLAEVEEETAFAFAALEQEFNTLVPTQRLWTKINESIEVQARQRSLWQKLLAYVSGINLFNPQIVAFGSMLLIVGVVSSLILLKNNNVSNDVAVVKSPVPTSQVAKIDAPTAPVIETDNPTEATKPREVEKTRVVSNPSYQIERVNYVETKSRQGEIIEPRRPVVSPVVPQYLDGEENYVKTIARLEQTVNENKDEVLKPSQRFSYEKDLAVVTDTIDKLKKEVRKNPKNEDAKQILFASYQNKIELLNSVTQRAELMASLR